METAHGLKVTTKSAKVIENIDHFHDQIVSMGPSADQILTAVAENPDNLLLNSYAAAFYTYGQEDALSVTASKYLNQAEKLLDSANLREKLMYQGIHAWHNKDYECALTIFTSLTQLFPRDTLAAKFAEWLFYCSGQKYYSHRYLALCEAMAKENQQDSHFLAMHSFALELSGHMQDAQNMAEKAISLEKNTPWAHHTLAHIYLATERSTQGIKILEQYRSTWDSIFSLVKGHNLWHLALFYLTNLQEQPVLTLYPEIFGPLPETPSAQIDAISLLWRLDLAGMPQEEKLKKEYSLLAHHPFEQYTGFNSAHFIYCLARCGTTNEVNKALKSIENYAQSLPEGHYHNLWGTVTLPFCKGIQAYANEDYDKAYNYFSPIQERYFLLGGSDAQDDLFSQTYLNCLVKLHKDKEAHNYLASNLSYYKNTPLAEYWFSSKN
ncbi:MAG: tetratricopeptide repeat protein [Legionella sp.]|jgi:hypothetical protein